MVSVARRQQSQESQREIQTPCGESQGVLAGCEGTQRHMSKYKTNFFLCQAQVSSNMK
jgi:hypothetical protein